MSTASSLPRAGVPEGVRAALAREIAAGRTQLPAVVLSIDAFTANAADLARRSCGVPIRVASKSLRMREGLRLALSLPGFAGVMCYSLREALWLVETGVTTDALVAYPTADVAALRELAASPEARAAITVTVDSPAHVQQLAEIAREAGLGSKANTSSESPINVCLDIDAALLLGRGILGSGLRIGALRSAVYSPEQASELAALIDGTPGLRLAGLLAYEGQIAGEGDAGASPRQAALRVLQGMSRRELARRRPAIVAAVQQRIGRELRFVNGGGTGSIESTVLETCITEIGAGSGLIGSGLFDGYRAFRPQPAEWFVLPVVRRPADGVATVLGGGRVASGAAGKSRLPRIDWPEGLRLAGTEGAGEVQTPVLGAAASGLRLGDAVWLRHAKAGEALEWANEVLVVKDGAVVDRWPSYRGEGKVFV